MFEYLAANGLYYLAFSLQSGLELYIPTVQLVCMSEGLIVVTLPHLPGYRIVRVLGAVHGLTVRTRGVGGKISAGISGIFGGEVHSYTEECERSKAEALSRLRDNAQQMGANAVIGADFETSDILAGTATVFSAYGTAVIVESEY